MQAAARLAIAVEKDRLARTALLTGLRRGGIARVQHRASPEAARELIGGGQALRLLAIGLHEPAHTGLDLIRECRSRFPAAVILAVDHAPGPDSAAEAFRAGVDDVLRTPYPESELVARLARRMGVAIPQGEVQAKIAALNLTPVEARIMHLLMTRSGRLVTRNELAKAIDDADWTYGDRKFDVHINRIRRKLRAGPGQRMVVRTIRAEGYSLDTSGD